MITKYIGSVDEFLNCEMVAFVNVRNNITLTESNIPKYLPTYELFSHVLVVNRDKNNKFIANFKSIDTSNFIVNYLIMYNSIGEPIGFTNLTQNIDIEKYQIETITLSFDYTIINKDIILNVKISYNDHLIKTKQKIAHDILFDNNQGLQTIIKSDLVSLVSNKKLYSKNLLEVSRDSSLLYRYSGWLSKGDELFLPDSLVIDKDLLNSVIYSEIVSIDDIKYILLYDGSKLTIVNSDIKYSYNIFIESQLHIGSNFVMSSLGNGRYKLYPTRELVKGEFNAIKSNTREYIDSEVNLIISDLIISDTYVCKDPITKYLMLYSLTEEGLQTYDNKLISILELFGNPKIESQIPIYASDGLLFTAQLKGNIIEKCSWYTYTLPGTLKGSKLDPIYDMTTYFNELDEVDLIKLQQSRDDLESQFNLLTSGLPLDSIIFLTTELMLIMKPTLSEEEFRSKNKCTYNSKYINTDYPINTKDVYLYYVDRLEYNNQRGSNKYLLNISTEFNYNPKIYDFESKLSIFNLMGRTGLRNYDKLFKSQVKDILNLTLTKFTLDGNLYGRVDKGNFSILYKI